MKNKRLLWMLPVMVLLCAALNTRAYAAQTEVPEDEQLLPALTQEEVLPEETLAQTLPTEPEQTEPEFFPAQLTFQCDREDVTVMVYSIPDDPQALVSPQADGTYLLSPGVYYYQASCVGCETVEKKFTVSSGEVRTETIELRSAGGRTAAQQAAESWMWPVPASRSISSNFGLRDINGSGNYDRFHNGIDIYCGMGSPVFASKSGVVFQYCNDFGSSEYIEADDTRSYGNYVAIRHDDGTYSIYSHMSNYQMVTSGPVRQGDLIGYSGNSGWSTGPHLHFQARSSWSGSWHEADGLMNTMPTQACIDSFGIDVKYRYVEAPGYSAQRIDYIFQDDGGRFSSEEVLKEHAGKRYSDPIDFIYTGTDTLVLSGDIELPDQVQMYVDTLEIAPGARLKISGKNSSLHVNTLILHGSLEVTDLWVAESYTGSGELHNLGRTVLPAQD